MIPDARTGSERAGDERACSWNELSDLLFADAWQEGLARLRSPWVFRGQGDEAFDLSTSLQRMRGDFAQVETPMLRAFRRYANRYAPHGGDTL